MGGCVTSLAPPSPWSGTNPQQQFKQVQLVRGWGCDNRDAPRGFGSESRIALPHPRSDPTFRGQLAGLNNKQKAVCELSTQSTKPRPICARRASVSVGFSCETARSGSQSTLLSAAIRPHSTGVRPSQPQPHSFRYFPFRQAGLRSTTGDRSTHPTRCQSSICIRIRIRLSIYSVSIYLHIHLPVSSRSLARHIRSVRRPMIRAASKRPRPDSSNITIIMRPSAPAPAPASAVISSQPALMTALVYQYVLAATSAILVHMLLRSSNANFGGSSETVAYQQHSQSEDPSSSASSSSSSSSSSCGPSTRRPSATATSAPSRGADSIHQTGTKYRSNNAGDGPEKTRDRKSWFPRFKSNWLGTYRSKQMFHCCECAVMDVASARYKGSEGKHCVCGQDQWHLAKTIEEAEYNRRMEISKALGGLRYDEALERLKAMGTSELDLKRLRCESDEASVTSSSTSSSVGDDSNSADGPHASSSHKRIKNEPLPSPATRAYGSQQRAKAAASFGLDPVALPSVNASTGLTAELLQKINQSYSSGSYTPLGGDYLGGAANYDHLVPASFADEENFGELLQGFLEDDPRHTSGSGYPSHYHPQQQPQHSRQAQYSYNNNAPSYIPGGSSAPMGHQQPHHQRYPQAPSTLPPPPQGEVDFEFFSDGHHRTMAPAQMTSSSASSPGYYGQLHHSGAVPHSSQYGRPHLAHPHSGMAAPLASSTSFSIV